LLFVARFELDAARQRKRRDGWQRKRHDKRRFQRIGDDRRCNGRRSRREWDDGGWRKSDDGRWLDCDGR
jgi:hypothetical protein